jgi:hypothetical protein
LLVSEVVCFALETMPSVSMRAMGLQCNCFDLWSYGVFSKQVPILFVPKWSEVNAS